MYIESEWKYVQSKYKVVEGKLNNYQTNGGRRQFDFIKNRLAVIAGEQEPRKV